MQDTESETFHAMNKNEEFCELLKKIDVDAKAQKLDTDELEQGNYYSKYFTHTPAMVTNHGIIFLKGSNIDCIQIIQKG